MSKKVRKMLYWIIFLIILGIAAYASCYGIWKDNRITEPALDPGIVFKLSEYDIKITTSLAENGDVSAMHKLWLHYGVYMDNKDTQDNFEYWQGKLIEAAKAGSQEAREIIPDWELRASSKRSTH